MSKNIVVFVHGFMGLPKQFEYLLPEARAAGWATRCLLLPGHGGDVAAFARSKAADWQAALDALLGELRPKYEKILLVGHSMGGLLSINACANDPDKICAVIAIALPLYIKATLTGTRIRLLTLLPQKSGEDRYVTAARECCGVGGVTLFNAVRLLPNSFGLLGLMRRTRALLQKGVSTPVLLLNSAADEIVSQRSARFFARFVPDGRSVALTQSSHFWYSPEEQAVIARTLRGLLSQE